LIHTLREKITGRNVDWSSNDIPDLSGKLALVTGANTGIGLEIAKVLAGKNAKVILACRNESRASKAMGTILTEFPDAEVCFEELDLSRLASVRTFAIIIQNKYEKLDILINNAGCVLSNHQLTEDGFDEQFSSNYLGHFALTGHLLPLLQQTEGSRVVSVSSPGHRLGKIDFENLNAEKGYHRFRAYGFTKLACLMFTYELQRRLKKNNSTVLSVAAHPGTTVSELGRHSVLLALASKFMQRVSIGALPILRAATDKNVKGGEYYGPKDLFGLIGPPVLCVSSKRSYDENVAAELWRISEKMTDLALSNNTIEGG